MSSLHIKTSIYISTNLQVPGGKMAEFRGAVEKFYTATRAGQGAASCLYYGSGSHALARTASSFKQI